MSSQIKKAELKVTGPRMKILEIMEREIAFPKTQKATCPLTDAPSTVSRAQLTELHLRPDWKEEGKA